MDDKLIDDFVYHQSFFILLMLMNDLYVFLFEGFNHHVIEIIKRIEPHELASIQ